MSDELKNKAIEGGWTASMNVIYHERMARVAPRDADMHRALGGRWLDLHKGWEALVADIEGTQGAPAEEMRERFERLISQGREISRDEPPEPNHKVLAWAQQRVLDNIEAE